MNASYHLIVDHHWPEEWINDDIDTAEHQHRMAHETSLGLTHGHEGLRGQSDADDAKLDDVLSFVRGMAR